METTIIFWTACFFAAGLIMSAPFPVVAILTGIGAAIGTIMAFTKLKWAGDYVQYTGRLKAFVRIINYSAKILIIMFMFSLSWVILGNTVYLLPHSMFFARLMIFSWLCIMLLVIVFGIIKLFVKKVEN